MFWATVRQDFRPVPESKPQGRHLGYARVSTYGQTLDAQLDQLRKAGCTKIYHEKITVGLRFGDG